MDTQGDMRTFASELTHCGSPYEVEFSPLPSGLAYLHVRVRGRCFVMAYYPRHNGIGVDEVLDDEGFEMGYKYWFTDFESAKAKLTSLLNEAIDSATKPSS